MAPTPEFAVQRGQKKSSAAPLVKRESGMTDIVVSGGQTSSGISLYPGDTLTVLSGGTVVGTGIGAINGNNGVETVSSGGLDIGAVVAGRQVLDGGTASAATVYVDGSQQVSAGGTAVDTRLREGGNQSVFSGGTASGTVIGVRGTETVFSAGTTIDTVIEGPDALLDLKAGAIVSGDVSFALPGGKLVIEDTTNPTFAISGFAPGDIVDLPNLAFDGSGTATLVSGNVLRITENGSTFDLQLDPSQSFPSQTFALAADGVGGTLIAAGSGSVVSSGVTSSGVLLSGGNTLTVMAGGAASATTIGSAGLETIMAGGSDLGATVFDGGTQIVAAGGTTTGVTVSSTSTDIHNYVSFGSQAVFGTASATILNGGFQTVAAGGVALNTTAGRGVLYGSVQIVEAGGFASGTVLNDGGYAGNYGVESAITVNSDSQLAVFAGGMAFDTVVNSGGSIFIGSGGTASGVTIRSGGSITVLPGGEVTFLNSESSIVISGGQTSSGIVLDFGETLGVLFGGTASATTINNGGVETVSSGGIDLGAVVNEGGVQIVEAGGAAFGGILQSVFGGADALQRVFGVASGTLINGGGRQIVEAGGFAGGVVLDTTSAFPFQDVFGTVSGTTINGFGNGAGFVTVASGGLAIDTTVNRSLAHLDLQSGATASGTVLIGGREFVAAGASDFGATISAQSSFEGGAQDVAGTAIGATVFSASYQYVESGGAAIGTTVWGVQYVFDGGTASAASVFAGGIQTVYSGGTASDAAVLAGGLQQIFSGGITIAPVISGPGALVGLQVGAVVSGGVSFSGTGGRLQIGGTESPNFTISGLAPGNTIDLPNFQFSSSGTAALGSGNVLHITENGSAVDLQLDPNQVFAGGFGLALDPNGGTLIVPGTAVGSGQTSSGVVLNAGDTLAVLFGGTASATTINNGGIETISSGGLDVGALVTAGGQQIVEAGGIALGVGVFGNGPLGLQRVFGVARGTQIGSFGRQIVEAGGFSSGATLAGFNSYAYQDVFGAVSATTINANGSVHVASGGSAIGTVVNLAFARIGLEAGAIARDTVVNGGREDIGAGARETGATIGGNGIQTVQGIAAGTTVLPTGTQHVESGGAAVGTTVWGNQTVVSGGTASGTTVLAGGLQQVVSGGRTIDTVISGPGAQANIYSGGVASGGISFSGVGGRLVIFDTTSPSFTISGLVPGNTIDLANTQFSSSGTAVLGSGNVLHVTENGGTFDLQLDPNQNFFNQSFGLLNIGGTQIVEFSHGQLLFSDDGFAGTSYGFNDGITIPTAVSGNFNVEVFTALPIGAALPPLDPGFQIGIIDPSGLTLGGYLVGRQVQLFAGDFLVGDVFTADHAPAQIILGSGNQTVVGAAGDTLIGGSGNQVLIGNQQFGAESIVGGTGAYTVFGGIGDTVTGNPGATTGTTAQIVGAGGMTIVLPNAGNYTVGGASGDTITAAAGSANALIGGAAGGIVNLTGNTGTNTIIATAGDQTVIGGSGNTTIYGGAGDVLVAGAAGSTYIDGQFGGMKIVGGTGGSATIIGAIAIGNAGADTIIGNGGGSLAIQGLGNDDVVNLSQSTGNATVNALSFSPTDRLITLGGGPATVLGGVGDTIAMGSVGQYVDGLAGGMTILLGSGGLGAIDTVIGAASSRPGDTIIGGASSNLVYNARFNGGHDVIDLSGSSGNATINAFSEGGSDFFNVNDTIFAGSGADSIWGGDGVRIGVGSSANAGGVHLWGHSTTVPGAAVEFGTNDTIVATSYDTVGKSFSINSTLPGASTARVTIGGAAGDFDTSFDSLFYPIESAATNSAIVATAQSTDGGASSMIALPDGTVMTLVGVTQAELQAALAASTLFKP